MWIRHDEELINLYKFLKIFIRDFEGFTIMGETSNGKLYELSRKYKIYSTCERRLKVMLDGKTKEVADYE